MPKYTLRQYQNKLGNDKKVMIMIKLEILDKHFVVFKRFICLEYC